MMMTRRVLFQAAGFGTLLAVIVPRTIEAAFASRQYLVPGIGYVNEGSGFQYLLPRGGYLDESSQAMGVANTMKHRVIQ